MSFTLTQNFRHGGKQECNTLFKVRLCYGGYGNLDDHLLMRAGLHFEFHCIASSMFWTYTRNSALSCARAGPFRRHVNRVRTLERRC